MENAARDLIDENAWQRMCSFRIVDNYEDYFKKMAGSVMIELE